MLKIDKLEKFYGYRQVFENITFVVNTDEKIGIVGPNGVGKTTLLNILAGEDLDFNGLIFHSEKDQSMAFVKQDLTGEDYRNGKEWMELSGGMRTQKALKEAFERKPDILLLDEPNNHLDYERLEELETRLKGFKGTLLLVSHDRVLLDGICTHVVELSMDGCCKYTGNYSDYVKQKELAEKKQLTEYEKYRREKSSLKNEIVRRKEWYRSAHKAAGQNDFYRSKAKKQVAAFRRKETALARLEAKNIKKPWDVERINLEFLQVEKGPEILVRSTDLEKSYGENLLFEKSDFCILRGERYNLIGKNGTGKTTLLNMIAGLDESFSGTIEISKSAKFGYYTQHHLDIEDRMTVLEAIRDKGLNEAEARTYLGSFLIRGEHVFKNVGELSVGQKSKVALLRLLLDRPDLILLDEPVNHMDVLSREKIEAALESYKGTILFISHDRRFNEKLTTKVLSIENRKIVEYPGDYNYYLEKKQRNNVQRDSSRKGNMDMEGEALLLEMKISRLNSMLSDPTISNIRKEEMEKEFFDLVSKRK